MAGSLILSVVNLKNFAFRAMRKNADLAITFNTKQKVKLKLSRWNSEGVIDAALLIEEWQNEINP